MLSRPIKAALNRRAHAEGLAHENAVKDRLTAVLERMQAEGATHVELLAHVEKQARDGSEGQPG